MKPTIPFLAPALLGAVLFASFGFVGSAREPRDEYRIKQRKSIEVDDGALRCVAISPDGKVVACCGDRSVHLFDPKSGERINRLEEHKGAVNAVAFSPDGKWFASAGEDQTIRLWAVESWKPKAILKKSIQNDPASGTCLAFSPDSKTLASCSSVRPQTDLVWLWDVEKARWEHIVSTPHRGGCLHVTFSPDGKHVAVAGVLTRHLKKGGQVSLHEEADGLRFKFAWKHEGEEPATWVAFSPDSKTLASAGSDNTVRLWDVKTGKSGLKLNGPKGARGIRAVAFLLDGERMVSVSFEETLQLWDAANGKLLTTAAGKDKGVRSMALSANGKTVATCGEDKVINLWELSLPAKP